MSRAHADHLKRCYMSMGLDHEIMLGVQSQRAQAYDLLANIHTQVTAQDTPDVYKRQVDARIWLPPAVPIQAVWMAH